MADTGTLAGTVSGSDYIYSPSYEEVWLNPSRVLINDLSVSQNSPRGVNGTYTYGTEQLWIRGFDAQIPAAAAIDGIEVKAKIACGTAGEYMDHIRVSPDIEDAILNGFGGSTIGSTGELTVSAATWTIGSPTQLWGQTWTPADVNSANFGFCMGMYNNLTGTIVLSVDVMWIKVYYHLTGPQTHTGEITATVDASTALSGSLAGDPDFSTLYTFDALASAGNSDWTYVGPTGTGLQNSNTAGRWCWDNNGTTSSNVGPLYGQGGNPDGYVYTEASSQALGAQWSMTSPVMDASLKEWEFSFYLSADNDGDSTDFYVEAYNGSTWDELYKVNFSTGDAWHDGTTWNWVLHDVNEHATFNLASYTNSDLQIRFRTDLIAGTAWHNDIGIDTVTLYGWDAAPETHEGIVTATVDVTQTADAFLDTIFPQGSVLAEVDVSTAMEGTIVTFDAVYKFIEYGYMPADSLEGDDFSVPIGGTIEVSYGTVGILRFSVEEFSGNGEGKIENLGIEMRLNGGTWGETIGIGGGGGWSTHDNNTSNAPTWYWGATERLTSGTNFHPTGGEYDSVPTMGDAGPLQLETTELYAYFSVLEGVALEPGDYVEFRMLVIVEGNPSLNYPIDHTDNGYPRIDIVTPTARNIDQAAFRFRKDDGNETSATWLAALNTNANLELDVPYRLRFQLDQDAVTVTPEINVSLLYLEWASDNSPSFGKAKLIEDQPTTNLNQFHGSSIAVSGNGNVIALGCPDHLVSTSLTDKVIRTWRWNGTTEVWDAEDAISMSDLGETAAGRAGAGGYVELNYAGDVMFVSNSDMRSGGTVPGHVLCLHYSAGWTIHSQIPYTLTTLAMGSTYFGCRIMSNVAGDEVLIGDLTECARYSVSGTTWSGTRLDGIGATATIGEFWQASPDLGKFVCEYGYTYTWGGTSYTRADPEWSDTDYASSQIKWEDSRMMWTEDENHAVFVYGGVPDLPFHYRDAQSLYFVELNAGDMTDLTLEDRIPLELPVTSAQYGPWLNEYPNIWDGSDDLNVIVTCYPFSSISTTPYEGDENIWVYKRGTNTWVASSLSSNIETEVPPSWKHVKMLGHNGVYRGVPTTQQLGGGGTFVPAPINNYGISRLKWPVSGATKTEVEFCFMLDSNYVTIGDQISFAVSEYHDNYLEDNNLTTYTNIPVGTAIAAAPITTVQTFRGRDDDGSETAATWLAAESVGFFEPTPDEPFRLRYLLSEGVETAAKTYKLQFVAADETVGTTINYNRVTGARRLQGAIHSPSTRWSCDNLLRTRLVGDKLYAGTGVNQGAVKLQHWDDTTEDWADSTGTWLQHRQVDNLYFGDEIAMSGDGKWALVGCSGVNNPYGPDTTECALVKIDGTTISVYADTPGSETYGWCNTLRISENGKRGVAYGDGKIFTLTIPSVQNGEMFVNQQYDIPIFGYAYQDMAVSGNGKVFAMVDSYQINRFVLYDWSSDAQQWILRQTPANDDEGYILQDYVPDMPYGLRNVGLNWAGDELFLSGNNRFLYGRSQQSPYSTSRTEFAEYGTAILKWDGSDWIYNTIIEGAESVSFTTDAAFMYLEGPGGGLLERAYDWTDVPDQGDVTGGVRFADSPNLTDGQATTQQLGSGTFVAGDCAESQWPSTTWTATTNEETEIEFVLENVSSRLNLYRSIRYRLVESDGTPVYSNYYLKTYPEVIMPGLTQDITRPRFDNGSETTAGWFASANTIWNEEVGNTRRVRIATSQDNSIILDHERSYKLQWNKNTSGLYYVNLNAVVDTGLGNSAVDMSSDGLVCVVSNYNASWGVSPNQIVGGGEVYTYDKTGVHEWTKRTSAGNLRSPVPVSDGRFGTDMALNADGSTLYVGEPGYGTGHGRVIKFNWSGSAWVYDITIRPDTYHTGYPSSVDDNFGLNVSCSAADDIVAIGSDGYDGALADDGLVYMIRKTGGTWAEDGVIAGTTAGQRFGRGVSLSGNGVNLLVGGPGYNGNDGLVYCFLYTGGVWTVRNETLVGTGNYFGWGVGQDYTGSRVYVGHSNGYIRIYEYDGLNTASSFTFRKSLSSVHHSIAGQGKTFGIEANNLEILTNHYSTTTSIGGAHRIGIDYDWTDVGARTDTDVPIRYKSSVNVTDGEVTTQQLSAGAFDAGEIVSVDNGTVTYTQVGDTEMEYVVEFYDTGDSVNGDLFLLRAVDLVDDHWDELLYEHFATALMTVGLPLEGEVSAVVDTTVSTAGNFITSGAVLAEVDTVVSAIGGTQTDQFGELTATVDTTVVADATLDVAPKQGAMDLRVRTWVGPLDGRIAVRGDLDVNFGTRVFATPVKEAVGAVDATVEVSTLLATDNYVGGEISIGAEVSTALLGGVVHPAAIDLASTCSTTITGNHIRAAVLAIGCQTDVAATGGLTFAAECGIIGESNTNIEAQNYKNAVVDALVDTNVLADSHLFRGTTANLSSDTSCIISGEVTRSTPLALTVHTHVSITGYTIPACVREHTNITEATDSSTTIVSDNIDLIICGE